MPGPETLSGHFFMASSAEAMLLSGELSIGAFLLGKRTGASQRIGLARWSSAISKSASPACGLSVALDEFARTPPHPQLS